MNPRVNAAKMHFFSSVMYLKVGIWMFRSKSRDKKSRLSSSCAISRLCHGPLPAVPRKGSDVPLQTVPQTPGRACNQVWQLKGPCSIKLEYDRTGFARERFSDCLTSASAIRYGLFYNFIVQHMFANVVLHPREYLSPAGVQSGKVFCE